MKLSDFTVQNTHVPSDPNEKGEDGKLNPQVRWKVTLSYKGIPQGVFDYSTGIGHIPGYTSHMFGREAIAARVELRERVRVACQKGQSVRSVGDSGVGFGHKTLPGPTAADFVACLASDAMSWLDSGTVAEFASEFGYEAMGYAGAARANEAYEACARAFKTLSNCGLAADDMVRLQMDCDAA